MTGRAALFLDRDGVVCRAVVRGGKPFPAGSVQELDILPGVREALQRAGAQKLVRIIVTNQPDVARGTLTREAVESIHRWLGARLPLEEFRACYHDDGDRCQCRRPKPGMIVDAAREAGIDLSRSFMIGDR